MKTRHPFAVLCLVSAALSLTGCSSLSTSEVVAIDASRASLHTVQRAASGIALTPLHEPASAEAPSTPQPLTFSLQPGNHLVMATVDRAMAAIPLNPSAAARDFELAVQRQGKDFRFMVWNLDGAGHRVSLAADVITKAGSGRIFRPLDGDPSSVFRTGEPTSRGLPPEQRVPGSLFPQFKEFEPIQPN